MNSYRTITNSQPANGSQHVEKELKALIVDDETDICFLLKGILKHANIQADYVTSLIEAENFLRIYDPRIIFLDNHLPDGFGINYIREFKKHKPGTLVVMVTAHDTSADKERAFKEGADFFISKPFSKNSIVQALNFLQQG